MIFKIINKIKYLSKLINSNFIFYFFLTKINKIDKWHAFNNIDNRPYKKEVIDFCNNKNFNNILDYGCGFGDIVKKIKAKNKFAFDNDPKIIKISDILFKVRHLLIPGLSIVANVEIQRIDTNLRLLVVNIEPLEELMKEEINTLKVYVKSPETILRIRDRVQDKGKSKIIVHILVNGHGKYQTELSLGNNFIINPSIKASIKEIEGVLKIEEI